MDTAVRFATVCAFLLVAQQVAAKAVRDTLFLTQFDVTLLPRMIVTASIASILAVLGSSRALTRFGPHRMLPPALVTSAVLQLLLVFVQPYAPGLVAFLLYLHVCIFGAVLISWFWSMLNEGLDPSTARRRVGRIAGGGTFGGLVGGLLAERIAATWTTSALLPALAALHGVAAWLAWTTSRSLDVRLPAPSAPAPNRSGLRVLAEVPYLRQLGWLVAVGTVAATLLDYVFKARAAAALTDAGLLRCFALFYTATSLGSFVLQSALTRRLLERGIATTAASLPAVVAAGGAIALAFPTFLVTTVARGLEAAVRSSLFRSSYELFYTPV
ncbi:MAG: hypothetical protein KC591_11460, partial [Gemmatimonadetes bacterium]|nr:hypothetical protein [Gemmatimonadota bacterium]